MQVTGSWYVTSAYSAVEPTELKDSKAETSPLREIEDS